MNDFVDDIQTADPHANVSCSATSTTSSSPRRSTILEGGALLDLMDTLPPSERYSYVFDGNSQVLDQILCHQGAAAPLPEYDSCTSTRSSHDQAVDHDPQVARLKVESERTLTGARATDARAPVQGRTSV